MSIFDSFERKHDYLVCVDSDGCVMDTMNCKHFHCFGPCMVTEWGLEEWKDAILERWNVINLFSMTRGINRFKGLAMALGEIHRQYTPIRGIAHLQHWADTAPALSNDAIAKAEGEEKLQLIESQLQDCTQIIVDIYSRFLFEDEVIRRRKNTFLFAKDLEEIMINAQKEAYGDGLDPETLHPYMWCCKSHYYRAGLSYYNFPYAFGGLFARGLYACYEREGAAFVPKYKKLLYTTPIATVEDTAKVADIDLTDKNFWRAALQTIADQIDLFCQLVK